jgi:hypothetical protein
VALLLAYTIGLDKVSVTVVGVLAAVLLFGPNLAYEYSRGSHVGRPQLEQASPGSHS